MVHVFALADLVSITRNSKVTHPVRSWSKHQLPVDDIVVLPGGRAATSSCDQYVYIVEIFSEKIVASILFPTALGPLAFSANRLVVGGSNGVLHIIDLDALAMHKTAQSGATIHSQSKSALNLVFDADDEDTVARSELRGHGYAITQIHVLGEDHICSGDAAGHVRVWDLVSRSCVREISPWSSSSNDTTLHPVTSLQVLTGSSVPSSTGIFFSSSERSAKSIASLITPLQKYAVESDGKVEVPRLRRQRDENFWRETPNSTWDQCLKKRLRGSRSSRESTSGAVESGAEVARLQRELAEAQSTITRWETVNQKLIQKLEGKKKSARF